MIIEHKFEGRKYSKTDIQPIINDLEQIEVIAVWDNDANTLTIELNNPTAEYILQVGILIGQTSMLGLMNQFPFFK